jgi:hypothetical protein
VQIQLSPTKTQWISGVVGLGSVDDKSTLNARTIDTTPNRGKSKITGQSLVGHRKNVG